MQRPLSTFRQSRTVASLIQFVGLTLALAACFAKAAPPDAPPNDQAAASTHWQSIKPIIGEADGFGETPELIKLGSGPPVVSPGGDGATKLIPVRYYHRSPKAQDAPSRRDPVIQNSAPTLNTPSPSINFAGISNIDGYIPPDTVGAIGPSNYVQAVNVRVQVFNRFTGATQTAAVPISTLFSALGPGSPCATTDDGDPIVLYDPYADRWLIAQFANASAQNGPYYMSIAISKTSDPTGAYYAYCFQTPGTLFPDYPKLSVWPDGYYLTVNQFDGNAFAGAGVYAFDRAKMLAGDPSAQYIYFDVSAIDPNLGTVLPASVDGPLPPLGAPDYFVSLQGISLGDASDCLRVFEFHADFVNTNLSTFTERADSPVAVAAYTAFSPATPNVPQPGTSMKLDSLADRLMFRLQYRNFDTNESLVVTHTVTGDSGQAAIRYYQLRRDFPGGSFGINEQATYAPDTNHRWMGSAAMNYRGDLAVGYSVSSTTVFPSIRYAARLSTDPSNGLFQGEATLITGGGSQTSSGRRWGDYSAMTVDPTDDCTFWYTQEYYGTTSSVGWRTRIGSFSLPGCSPAPRATIQGTVSRLGTGLLLSNVVVHSDNGYVRVTGTNGTYSMNVTPGTYNLSAELPGLDTNTVASVIVTNGEVRVQNFFLGQLAPDVRTNSYSIVAEGCTDNVIDPGEVVTLNIGLKNIGPVNTANLIATLIETNGITSPSAPQNYGTLSTNGSPVSRPFTFVPVGTCGGSVAALLQLQNDNTNFGSVTLNLPFGGLASLLSEKFDSVVRPALPAGWTTATSGSQSLWVTSSNKSDTAPNAAFATDASAAGVNELVSPSVAVPASPAQLSFRHNYSTEATFDGCVLEIKIGPGGSFTDILSAGGSFVSGPYNATISSSFGNPLAGRAAWSGTSGSFITTIVNLPASAQGKNVQFKWRCASDISLGGTGWFVDSINVSAVVCCSNPTPPLMTPPSVTNSQFQFSLLGTPGSNYVVLASTNLSGSNWVAVQTNPAPILFNDTNTGNFPQRFFRGVVAP